MANKVDMIESVGSSKNEGAVALVPLKGLREVAVYTAKAFEKVRSDIYANKNLRTIFVQKRVTPNSVVAHPYVQAGLTADFVIVAPSKFRSYVLLWLNSSLGRGELLGGGFTKDTGMTSMKKIREVPIPLCENSEEYFEIGLLGDFYFLALMFQHEKNDNIEFSVAVNLYSRLINYASMELLIPSEFRRAGVSIIESWKSLLKDMFPPQFKVTEDSIIRSINEVFTTNNELMLNVNRMKIFNSVFYPICVETLHTYYK